MFQLPFLTYFVAMIYIYTCITCINALTAFKKTPTLSKSMNMNIWLIGTSNQFFKLVLKLKQNFWKNKVITGEIPFFFIGPFCIAHSICLNIGF